MTNKIIIDQKSLNLYENENNNYDNNNDKK